MRLIFALSFVGLVSMTSLVPVSISYAAVIDAQTLRKQCYHQPWTKEKWLQLKNEQFNVVNSKRKQYVALQLGHCLASADPEIRDGVAYQGLSQWLRDKSLTNETQLALLEPILNALSSSVNDEHGVYQPFAMLALAELARADRINAYLTDVQRQQIVKIGTDYLQQLSDYRGFDNQEGWRHGIAHSADLMLQLALNQAMTKNQLLLMSQSLAGQVSAHDQHAYVHGEAKRIAMAIAYLFLRKELTTTDWQNWLANVTDSKPFENWQVVYQSEAGLIRLHNTRNFLYAMYALIKASKNEKLQAMVKALEVAIKQVG